MAKLKFTSSMAFLSHASFRLAGLLLIFFSLFAASVSSAEPGHSYIGYQLGYQSTRGDVSGSGASVGLRGGFGLSSPLSVTLRGGFRSARTGVWGMGAPKDKIRINRLLPAPAPHLITGPARNTPIATSAGSSPFSRPAISSRPSS